MYGKPVGASDGCGTTTVDVAALWARIAHLEMILRDVHDPLLSELKPRYSMTKAAVFDLAVDIGKQVVAHIEHAYPEMTKPVAWKSARLSIRNATANAVLAAVDAADKGQDRQAIESNAKHRRTMRKLRKAAGHHVLRAASR